MHVEDLLIKVTSNMQGQVLEVANIDSLLSSVQCTTTDDLTLWKFVAENHTENFATLKITLKNNIKEGFTENYTEKRPLLFRNAKNG